METLEVSRLIVRQEGVGLSMLRNVAIAFIYKKYLRDNRAFNIVFVIYIYKAKRFGQELCDRLTIHN